MILQLREWLQSGVPHHKNTLQTETAVLPAPERVYINVSQHIGAPCQPIVAVGDHVKVGQKIADSDVFVSAPIHASVSGVVESLENRQIVIKSDGLQTIDERIQPPVIENDDDFVQAIKDSGLVGLGGAGFPTYIKMNFKGDAKGQIDTLIVNAAECEPYITADAKLALENTDSVLEGISAFAKHLQVRQTIIGVEDHNKEVVKTLRAAIKENSKYTGFKVKELPSVYPQGAEKVLIESCTDRILPLGKLPSDVGVVVANITTCATFADYLKTGMPIVSRRVTVSGDEIVRPQNVIAPIGTRSIDLIKFCGGFKKDPYKVLQGGPMMGTALDNLNTPTAKRTNAIIALSTEEAENMAEESCIRCGRCVDACPMGLLPLEIDKQVRAGNIEELKKLDLAACIECGLCSFVCPANRLLVHNIRIGKGMLREEAAKAQQK